MVIMQFLDIKELKEEIRKLRQAVEKIALYLDSLNNSYNGYYEKQKTLDK